jgi:hypothetical protein
MIVIIISISVIRSRADVVTNVWAGRERLSVVPGDTVHIRSDHETGSATTSASQP